ncbi:fungal-specific transcription factor domain-containing protein [Cladorrhinum sp. PSN332]|nr:fungal-specific transcription factor domain-containing protein [Cladorrhinum sp. PSN332]
MLSNISSAATPVPNRSIRGPLARPETTAKITKVDISALLTTPDQASDHDEPQSFSVNRPIGQPQPDYQYRHTFIGAAPRSPPYHQPVRPPDARQPLPHSPRPSAAGGGHPVQARTQPGVVPEGSHGIVALAAAATAVLGDSQSVPIAPATPASGYTVSIDDVHRSPGTPAMTAGSPDGPGGSCEVADGGGAGAGAGGGGGGGGGAASGGGGRKSKARSNPPQRAAIACANCRRSKIRCLNNNDGQSPCTHCLHNGRNCTYPEVTPTATKRSAEPTAPKSEQPERKRPRRVEDIAKTEGILLPSVIAEEVLSVSYLDQALWDQLFDLYRLHFSTELPFLHLATLKQDLSKRARSKQTDANPDRNLVLLGILALTARFSPKLVAYATAPRKPSSASTITTPSSEDAAMASAYYANVLTKALGGLKEAMTTASVERVQAFLMLGLYEWSQVSPKVGGMAAWMYIGNAIRMAMALGLNNGDKDPHKLFRPRTAATPAPSSSLAQSQKVTAKEVRRRTMFSCFILDRLLGCGKDRVLTIRSEELRIQLPCDERDFDRSNESFTGWLDASVGNDRSASPSLLGCFIRLVDLWGDISKWSFAGGRFTEEYNPPWSPTTAFYPLRQRLNKFFADLPECFDWSSENFYRNENPQDMSVYVSLHVVGALCKIMLFREYIPFIPLRCSKPVGPLDDPTFVEPTDQPGFWEEIADEVFRAARVIADLVELSQAKLPMSSLVCFAVWTAAYVGIYAIKFPHMDAKRRMIPTDWEKKEGSTTRESESGPTGILFKTLGQMSGPLRMAKTYVRHFIDFDHYYDKIKGDYRVHAVKKSAGESKLSLRLGGGGGGLEEWKEQGLKVVNNGEILAVESDDKHSSRGSTMEPGSILNSDHYNDYPRQYAKPAASSFRPINGAQQHSSPSGENDIKTGILKTENLHSPLQLHQRHLPPHQGQHPHPLAQFNGNSTTSPQITHDMSWDISLSMMENASFMSVYMQQTRDGVSDDFLLRHIDTYQSQPWIDAPGGNCFAYGEEFYPSSAGSTTNSSSMIIEGDGGGGGNNHHLYYTGHGGVAPGSGTGGSGGGSYLGVQIG